MGQLQADTMGAAGCGTNTDGEPSIHVSKDNLVGIGSERGLGNGSDFWSGTQVGGTTAANACALTYDGQPNAVGFGASGGDSTWRSLRSRTATGTYSVYVASLNLASVNVATCEDDGKTFEPGARRRRPARRRPRVDRGLRPVTALLTYHDIVTDNIDVLRSDDGGKTFVADLPGDRRHRLQGSSINQLGNIVIDHHNTAGAAAGSSGPTRATSPRATPTDRR